MLTILIIMFSAFGSQYVYDNENNEMPFLILKIIKAAIGAIANSTSAKLKPMAHS